MALQCYLNIPPLDPNNFTAQVRNLGGIGRTLNPTPGTPYGEFMRWIYVGVTGDVSYVKWDGTTQVLTNLVAGVAHPFLSVMINSSGTTATGIVVGS